MVCPPVRPRLDAEPKKKRVRESTETEELSTRSKRMRNTERSTTRITQTNNASMAQWSDQIPVPSITLPSLHSETPISVNLRDTDSQSDFSWHEDEGRHVCGVCAKTFTRAFGLKIHRRIHTGERPYVCKADGCTESFTQSCNLLRHQRRRHGVKAVSKKTEKQDFASVDTRTHTECANVPEPM